MTIRTIRALIRLALVFTLLPCSHAAVKAAHVPPHTTLLSGKAALPLFHQCSRPSPALVSGYWTPTGRDIRDMERSLAGLFQSQRASMRNGMRRDYRQYAGFLRRGHRMLYINAIPPSGDARWKTQAMVACDGGPAFYGVEYDIRTRQFQNLAFNGPPEGKGSKR